ncbi:MAG: efflux RND transporter periplasmic adaptor subunit [Bryobacteraceae bacterium]|nr:efflux RND transporter periplasmic adaptor subunit [Bryobacteraceae bacterium]
MDAELKSLKIDRGRERQKRSNSTRWIIGGVILFLLLGAANVVYRRLDAPIEVATTRVPMPAAAGDAMSAAGSVLDATGYIVAAHKIEVASKVIGKVAWIGVNKGDRVAQGQVIVRLEDEEYRANLQTAIGGLESLQARLAEAKNGSRPEEIQRAQADLDQAQADRKNAQVSLGRTRSLVSEGVLAQQTLDDAVARMDGFDNRVKSLERTLALAKLGPRQETLAALSGSVREAQGRVEYAQTQLNNTVIRAPVQGTILERNVEKGEFVTTGFSGVGGAKGFVVSLADLKDIEVELDINQSDFAKLRFGQKAIVFTDAYPDKKYAGSITEISPEANRQKATVQVKVKILSPDDNLRPEMNATVQFQDDQKREPAMDGAPGSLPVVIIPKAAVRNGSVWIVERGEARKRIIRPKGENSAGLKVEGLNGGETLILDPPATLKIGAPVRSKP